MDEVANLQVALLKGCARCSAECNVTAHIPPLELWWTRLRLSLDVLPAVAALNDPLRFVNSILEASLWGQSHGLVWNCRPATPDHTIILPQQRGVQAGVLQKSAMSTWRCRRSCPCIVLVRFTPLPFLPGVRSSNSFPPSFGRALSSYPFSCSSFTDPARTTSSDSEPSYMILSCYDLCTPLS